MTPQELTVKKDGKEKIMRSNIENKNAYNAIASKFNVMAGEKEK